MAGYRLSAAAQDDLLGLLAWTEAHHGTDARKRYQALIVIALRDIASRPDRVGSVQRPELGQGVRSWHLRMSRDRVAASTGIVRRPRHFLVYRSEPGQVLVGRVLHDSMELARHLNASTWKDG
jgi:toxin ParE1/3/4